VRQSARTREDASSGRVQEVVGSVLLPCDWLQMRQLQFRAFLFLVPTPGCARRKSSFFTFERCMYRRTTAFRPDNALGWIFISGE